MPSPPQNPTAPPSLAAPLAMGRAMLIANISIQAIFCSRSPQVLHYFNLLNSFVIYSFLFWLFLRVLYIFIFMYICMSSQQVIFFLAESLCEFTHWNPRSLKKIIHCSFIAACYFPAILPVNTSKFLFKAFSHRDREWAGTKITEERGILVEPRYTYIT